VDFKKSTVERSFTDLKIGFVYAVCPANWTPDSPTIKPDPVKAQEYFGKVK
jgi:alkyl hydroperoxide reductase subunit AhpC